MRDGDCLVSRPLGAAADTDARNDELRAFDARFGSRMRPDRHVGRGALRKIGDDPRRAASGSKSATSEIQDPIPTGREPEAGRELPRRR